MPPITPRTPSYRLAILAGLVLGCQAFVAAPSALAQSNPLEKQSENPLDRGGVPYLGPDLDLPARLAGDGLTLILERLDDTSAVLSGQIRMGDNTFPFTGTYKDATRLDGSFVAGGSTYEFSLQGDRANGYSFKTGQSAYRLRDEGGRAPGRAGGGERADPAQLKRASDAMAAQNIEEALRICRPLADRGHVGASYLVGMCSAFGLSTKQDLDAARRFFETAARGEHPSALFELGVMFNEGTWGEPDNAAAIAHFERSARLGALGGIMSYGEMLLNGIGRDKDFVEGIAWVGLAADRGSDDAKQMMEYFGNDKSVSAQDRERVKARTAELVREIPDASKLDDLIDYDRFVAPAEARRTGKDERPQAADPLAGEWTGSLSEQMDDGRMMRAPIKMSVARAASGGYTADVVVELQMPADDGRMVDVRAAGRFEGGLQGDRATLRAGDTMATVVQTGESGSMGPQQMEFTISGDSISGRLGNDYDGWSQFSATRTARPATRPGGNTRNGGRDGEWRLQGGGATTGLGRPAGAGGVSAASSVTLEPVALPDPEMGGAPSHTLLVPQGWRHQGGARWSQPQLYLDMVHLDLRVTAPDGAAFGYYPGANYTWSDIYQINAQMGVPGTGPAPRPGQATGDGLTFMPLPQTTGEYVQTMLIPQNRPEATDVQVLEASEMSDVLATLRELLGPTIQSMEQQNQAMRQMGGGETNTSLFADRVRVRYRENGVEFEEDVYVTGYAFITRIPMSMGPVATMARWGVEDVRMVRTPVGGSPNRAIADAASLSVRPDPKWLATVMQLRAQINKTVSDGIAERGRINREAMQKSFEIHQESVRSRQASNDRLHHQFINYIRDVEDYKTPSGNVVQLPSQYNHAYTNGQGQFMMSNAPLSSSSGWTQINRASP